MAAGPIDEERRGEGAAMLGFACTASARAPELPVALAAVPVAIALRVELVVGRRYRGPLAVEAVAGAPLDALG